MDNHWIQKSDSFKELKAPFCINNDSDYYNCLKSKYNFFIKKVIFAGADEESIRIINKYKEKILEAVRSYYNADISKSSKIIYNLLHSIGEHPLAVGNVGAIFAFDAKEDEEIQLFRSRNGNPANAYTAKEMMFLPTKMRAKSGNYRFSIPGNPSLYLSNSSYGCWIETGFPPENEFNVSPALLDGTQKIFNLAVTISDIYDIKENDEDKIHCWLKLFMLSIATSFIIKETGRGFKSEYMISQAIMMACKKLNYQGVAYYSKRVSKEAFARCAINLALFVNYSNNSSNIENHIKIDDSFNFSIFKQLLPSLTSKYYPLKTNKTGRIINIGNSKRSFPYNETEFFEFDKFLFASWKDRRNGKNINQIPWGISLE